MTAGWWVSLNNVSLAGCAGDPPVEGLPVPSGVLLAPPDGLGLPELRTEDVVFPQRDGTRHFSDWYDSRIVTLRVSVCPDAGCVKCPSSHVKVRDIVQAWKRQCDDVELVIFPDCYDPDCVDRSLTGPFGIVGRPRLAQVTWLTPSRFGCAEVLLRFDAVDHKIFVLDCDGTPGSGSECVTLDPTITEHEACYPRCYPRCYDTLISPGGGGPVSFTVSGTECVCPTVTLTGGLTSPLVENTVTGQKFQYQGVIAAGSSVVVDLCSGSATENGVNRTGLLTGEPVMMLSPGLNTLRLSSFSVFDSGNAEVCWRPTVLTV